MYVYINAMKIFARVFFIKFRALKGVLRKMKGGIGLRRKNIRW